MALRNSSNSPVNPFMVQIGRESRGLSQSELAMTLGVTQGRISKIETGALPVPDDFLEALAAALDYPVHFFRQEGAPMGIGIAEVFHRKRADVPKKHLDKIHAQLEVRRWHVANLMRAAEATIDVPRLDPDEYGEPEEIARIVRAKWGLPRGPIHDLTEVMERSGIVIVMLNFETTRVDAISRWVPNLPPLVFANDQVSADRCRFSLAHETGHLVMHQIPSPDIEDEANRFAAEFLLPSRDILPELRDLTLAKLARLKLHWRVSMQALLQRAKDLGTLSPSRWRALWIQMTQLGYRTREPAEYDLLHEEPRLLRELVEIHVTELGYSAEDLQELIPLNSLELWSEYLRNLPQSPGVQERPNIQVVPNRLAR